MSDVHSHDQLIPAQQKSGAFSSLASLMLLLIAISFLGSGCSKAPSNPEFTRPSYEDHRR